MNIQLPNGKQMTTEEWKTARENVNKSQRPFYPIGSGEKKTAGNIFVKSDAYKRFLENGQSFSDAVPYKKDLVSVSAGGNLLGDSMYLPDIFGGTAAGMPTSIRDLLNVQNTANNAIYFMEQTTFINAAAPTAEKVAAAQSDITFEERMAAVKNIAHYLPATNQVLADVAGLQNYIDTQLMIGLKNVEENQLLYGSGTGEDLFGLMVHTGVQNAGIRGTATMIDHIRRTITMASEDGDIPSGVVLNANDWEVIETQKDTAGRYLIANVANGGEQRIFRIPVVVSAAMPAGSFLTGAFKTGATIFDREAASIKISDSHADYFIRRMKAIMAEERLAFAIQKPAAFVKGSFATA